MSIFACGTCGHLAFNAAPEKCPSCGSAQDGFTQNDNVFTESAEKSKEAAVKHIPQVVVNKQCGLIPEQPCVDVVVRIGETLHPMEEKHHIQFVDCYVDDTFVSRISLTPDVYAAGAFHLKAEGKMVRVVENCNLHGYWQTEAAL